MLVVQNMQQFYFKQLIVFLKVLLEDAFKNKLKFTINRKETKNSNEKFKNKTKYYQYIVIKDEP